MDFFIPKFYSIEWGNDENPQNPLVLNYNTFEFILEYFTYGEL